MAGESGDLAALRLPTTFADPIADTQVRLLALAEALAVDRPALFVHQVTWYKVAFAHREVPSHYLPRNLDCMAATLAERLPVSCRELAARHLDAARAGLAQAPAELPSLLADQAPLLDVARRFLLAALENRAEDALDLIRGEQGRGTSVADLHDHVLGKVLAEAGRMWLMAEIPVADEHYASRVVERAIELLAFSLPRPAADAPTVLTMAVGGNLHGIGIRMVADRFVAAGWNTMHLGADTPASDLEWALQDRQVQLIALSASTVLNVAAAAATVTTLRRILGKACPPILVGGEPFRVVPDLAQVIGADASAGSAGEAVAVARRLVAAAR